MKQGLWGIYNEDLVGSIRTLKITYCVQVSTPPWDLPSCQFAKRPPALLQHRYGLLVEL